MFCPEGGARFSDLRGYGKCEVRNTCFLIVAVTECEGSGDILRDACACSKLMPARW